MKRTLLLITLLFSAPAFAVPFEAAQKQINDAQARVTAQEKKIAHLQDELKRAQDRCGEVPSEAKYADDMSRRKNVGRNVGKELNKAVDELRAVEAQLQTAISEVSGEHAVSHDGKCASIQQVERPKLEPTVIRTEQSARRY